MTRSGQDPRTPPGALTGGVDGRPAPGSLTSTVDRGRGLQVLAFALFVHMLRSRRFYERVAFAAVVLGALAAMGQENRAKSFERLAAWVKRQDQRVERKVKAQLKKVLRSTAGLAPSEA